jgi:putative aminopeptidase FrvX
MPGNRDLDRLVPQLALAYGPPGREAGVRALLMRALAGVGRRETDALGNLHVHVPGRGPKLLIAAHMDAPGVIVTRTEASGLARLTQLGGPAAPDLVGASVRFEDGTRAVVGCDRPKDGKEIEADALFLHAGLSPAAAKKRLPVGAVGGLDGGAERLGDVWCGVNLDDRAGCAAVAAAALHPGRPVRYDLHIVFTAQSEVGARGAATGAFGIEPDLAVAVDVAYAGDGAGAVATGAGPCIGILELGYVPHPAALDLARRAARQARVKPQYLVREDSGSDARTIRASRSGVPTVVLAIPARQTGSPRLLVHRKDIEQTTLLLQRLLTTPWRA